MLLHIRSCVKPLCGRQRKVAVGVIVVCSSGLRCSKMDYLIAVIIYNQRYWAQSNVGLYMFEKLACCLDALSQNENV